MSRKRGDAEYELVSTKKGKYEPDILPTPIAKKQPRKLGLLPYCLMIFFAVFIKAWQPIAIANAKDEDGKYKFQKTAMVILVEMLKFFMCIPPFLAHLAATEPHKRKDLTDLPFVQSLHFLVPSLLYGASNTLVYLSLAYMNPALFHVFGNIRIITTGLLQRVMMGSKKSDVQWVALVLLTIGAVIASPGVSNPDLMGTDTTAFLGLIFTVLMCLCSTSSSIYTEKYYKKTEGLSIFYQNILMYLYGMLVNTIYLLFTEPEVLFEKGLTYGFDFNSYVVLFVQAVMGVSLSFIFKYLDNIVYVISLTVSMLLTVVYSAIFLDFTITIAFMAALAIVTTAVYLYYRSSILEYYGLDERRVNF